MKLSWSHKLFLYINSFIGKNPWRDTLMYFFAHWLIWVLGLFVLAVIALDVKTVSEGYSHVYSVVFRLVGGLAVSYIYAFFFRHKRPFVEFPEIQTLMRTKTSWKSFPSDHSFISFTLAFSLYFFAVPWYIFCIGIGMAIAVACGRVYVGVHYPRDIIGGFVLALVVSFLPFIFL